MYTLLQIDFFFLPLLLLLSFILFCIVDKQSRAKMRKWIHVRSFGVLWWTDITCGIYIFTDKEYQVVCSNIWVLVMCLLRGKSFMSSTLIVFISSWVKKEKKKIFFFFLSYSDSPFFMAWFTKRYSKISTEQLFQDPSFSFRWCH